MTVQGRIYTISKQGQELDANAKFLSMIQESVDGDVVVIDGRNIAAGSIYASQIHADAITADHIRTDAITSDHILAGSINVDRLKGNQLILPGETYGGVTITNDGLSMTSTGLDINLSSSVGFNISDKVGNQLIDINPITGNVLMQVNEMVIGGHRAATQDDIDERPTFDDFIKTDKVVIDGGNITANSLHADSIKANTITANEIASNAITADKIAANAITIGKMPTADKNIINDASTNASSAISRIGTVEGKINNAVTTIDGTGVTVKDGSFFLVDDTTDTKYAVPTKENLIKNHSFELVNNDSKTGKLHMQGSEWEFIQEDPYELLPGAGFIIAGSQAVLVEAETHAPMNFFGNYSMMVNNKNYLNTELSIRDNGYYTISAYFRRPPYAGRGGQPRFKLYEYDARDGYRDIGTFTFDKVEAHGDIKRYSTTFYARAYAPTGTYDYTTEPPSQIYSYAYTHLEIMSANSDFVQVDGVQLVEGKTPVVYDAEVNHWDFINGGSSVNQLSTRSIMVGGIDGKVTFGNSRIGTSEIYTGDVSSSNTGLNIRGDSGINLLGGQVNVKGKLSANGDMFANGDKKVPTVLRSSFSVAPNVWVTINLPGRGLYILSVSIGSNPGAYIVGNWDTGLGWTHLGGTTATIERTSETQLRLRIGGWYQYGLVHLN